MHDSPEVKARGTVERLFAERQERMTGVSACPKVVDKSQVFPL